LKKPRLHAEEKADKKIVGGNGIFAGEVSVKKGRSPVDGRKLSRLSSEWPSGGILKKGGLYKTQMKKKVDGRGDPITTYTVEERELRNG